MELQKNIEQENYTNNLNRYSQSLYNSYIWKPPKKEIPVIKNEEED